MRRHCLRSSRHGLGEKRRGAHLAQDVETVVARRAVGSEAKVHPRVAQRFDGREAARQLQVGGRAMRDRTSVGRQQLYLFVLQMDRMHGDQIRPEQAEAPQPLERPYAMFGEGALDLAFGLDRKSTRLNSSHGYISYAVFCLKKKRKE